MPQPQDGEFLVKGEVRGPGGRPLAGLRVRASDEDLPSLQVDEASKLLGATTTDGAGRYEIRYAAEQFRRAEKGGADLLVRALGDGEAVLASSPVIFNAGREETVDLVASATDGKAPSEYERYLAEIAPLIEHVEAADLTADDVAFLAGETGIDSRYVTFLTIAARHGRATDLPAAVFYGFAREKLPTELTALLAQPPDLQRAALKAALAKNVIPARLGDGPDQILAQLKALRIRFMLQPPGEQTPSPLSAILGTVLPAEQQSVFLTLYTDHQGDVEGFWDELGTRPEFGDGVVGQLQYTLQLGVLTGGNAPLVQALRQENFRSTRELVDLDVGAWAKRIRAAGGERAAHIPPHIAGTTTDEKIANYAGQIVDALKAAFPTRYVARGLAEAPAIDAGLARRVLELNPDLDLSEPVPEQLNWGDMGEDEQAKARDALAALHAETAMFRGFDYHEALAAGDAFRNPIREGVHTFLTNAADFDFGDANVDDYVAERGEGAFAGVDQAVRDAVTSQLRAMQRVYQVTPRYEQMRALMTAGVSSSRDIAAMPPEFFAMQFGAQGGNLFQWQRIHENAERVHADTLAAYGAAVSVDRDVIVRVIGGAQLPDRVRATYPRLFGALDLCACEHCRSVYSPAAYLVDLLHLLDGGPWQITPRGPVRPITVLQRRRPDIQHVPLTCENTNTLIPYVDLVNEVLEAYVAHDRVPDRSLGDAGAATSDELLASPQRVNDAAYEALRTAVYPFSLPFDRALETVRVHLEHLGTTRHAVMRTFQATRPLTADAQTDLAVEYLKIGPDERDVLTGAIFAGRSPRTLAALYGYAPTADGLPPAELETVAVFLERTGLRYEDLTRLLQTRFLNPDGPDHKHAVVIADPTNSCDSAARSLRRKQDVDSKDRSLQGEQWDRLQRFIRLWRKLGWAIHDMDRALTAFGVAESAGFDLRFLRRLGQAAHLRDDLGLSLAQTLSLWADIDTHGDGADTPQGGSLYAGLFLGRTVRELAAHPRAFELPTPAEVPDGARTISAPANYVAIQAALRTTATELDALREWTRVGDALTLGNLSALHRHAVLARALRLPVRDLLGLATLTGVDPFAPPPATPGNGRPTEQEGTARFVELARKVQRSGFSVALLEYLYRHRDDPARRLGPTPEEVDARLVALRDGLRTFLGGFDAPAPEPERLRRVLAAVVADAAAVERVLALPAGVVESSVPLAERPPVSFPDDLRARIVYDEPLRRLRFRGAMREAERVTLRDLAGHTEPYRAAVDALFELPRATIVRPLEPMLKPADTLAQLVDDPAADWSSRYAYLLPRALEYLGTSFVVQHLADALRLEADATQALLATALRSPGDGAKPLLADFLALRRVSPPPRPDAPEPLPESARLAFRSLHKAALLVGTFGLTVAELVHLATNGGDFGGFDLNALPLSDAAPPASFASWERVYDLVAFRATLPRGDGLVQVFGATSLAAATDALLAATGWERAALDSALGAQDPRVTEANFREFFRNEVRLPDLAATLTLARRLGVPPAAGFAWAARAPDAAQAGEVQGAVRAKYDEQAWLAVAKRLNDPLRERRRDALVAYVLALPSVRGRGVRTADELFEYFLIDVEMGACMATSRVKQAISSVQLFIQRCFMNLEEDVPPNALRADWWEWMRNYRVWEANRKVFLYPENWIEPSLRDDKTPFFKELENELLQNDVTEETAEAALLTYLEKLDEVARLDVRGVYWEHESELTWDQRPAGDGAAGGADGGATDAGRNGPEDRADVLHVFARTQGTPPVYYYRRLVDRRTWTPWEKVQADVEGDHLIPVVYNRRLYLFWPIFRETTDPDQAPPRESEPRAPVKRLEIQLAWSEYRDGTWSAKRTTRGKIETHYVPAEERGDFFFRAEESQEGLTLRCGRADRDWLLLFSGAIGGGPTGIVVSASHRAPGVRAPRTDAEIIAALLRTRGTSTPLALPADTPLSEVYRVNLLESYRYTDVGGFTITGCSSAPDAWAVNEPTLDPAHWPVTPGATRVDGQMFAADGRSPTFVVRGSAENQMLLLWDASRYRVAFPHQFYPYRLQGPFFFQDQNRTYFVTPERAAEVVAQVQSPDKARPGYLITTLILSSGSSVQRAAERSGPAELGRGARGWTNTIVCLGDPDGNGRDAIDPAQPETQLHFRPFYHPHVCRFIQALKRRGVPGLLALDNQVLSDVAGAGGPSGDAQRTAFARTYDPTGWVDPRHPREDVDFGDGAYAAYNWELFFHIPLLIATRLSANQRFDEALRWFHFVFDPTTNSTDPIPQRFWKTLPFYHNSRTAQEHITELLELLSYRGRDPERVARRERVKAQVAEWRDDPFNPHRLARLRPAAYQKAVVMKYIDTLIAWGDQLFRQDTIESINQATQLYVLASLMLGPRPKAIPPQHKPAPKTFADLRPALDAFSNALVATENAVVGRRCAALAPRRGKGSAGGPTLGTLYFCVPQNDELLGYWDTVADRLFKVRHCMNIEGVARQLPLFEPPIDPALLVRARAAGVDLGSVVNDTHTGLPHYRFTFTLQKALELSAELRSLGAALLAAYEKRDAEELALLRSTHETRMLEQVRLVRQKQVEEAEEAIAALEKSKLLAETRRDFYRDVVKFSPEELLNLALQGFAITFQGLELAATLAAPPAHQAPNGTFGTAGWAGSPVVTGTYGGQNAGQGAEAAGKVMRALAGMTSAGASVAASLGSYNRRNDEWELQERLANKELDQIDKQLLGARVRQAIAEQELRNHELQAEQTRVVDEFMRSRKFTRRELYDWTVSQLSAVYFQAYQLAYDTAKRAERAYRLERGVAESGYVRFGAWDSLRRGLLAGEQLTLDLKRLEAAYLAENRREYELTKHVSLVLHDPTALLALKTGGRCVVQLPESLFDADYPGHYMRRVKSVGLTIPAVTGPYTGVNCTLTLLKSKVRASPLAATGADYPEGSAAHADGAGDGRFLYDFTSTQSIATSQGQNDSGTFELSFRDERYLPFENAGAVSLWRIELPRDTNAFDLDTVTDVILRVNYTAREGGEQLRDAARQAAGMPAWGGGPPARWEAQAAPARLFSARHEFPTAWQRFLHGPDPRVLLLDLTPERFPFRARGGTASITRFDLFLQLRAGGELPAGLGVRLRRQPPAGSPQTSDPGTWRNGVFAPDEAFAGVPHATVPGEGEDLASTELGPWALEATGGRFDPALVEDLVLVCRFR